MSTEPERFLSLDKSITQGMLRYDYLSALSGQEKLIYFGLIKDSESYGDNRDFNQFMDLLIAQGQERASMALLISSEIEFDRIVKIIEDRQDEHFSRITLLLDPQVDSLSRGERHDDGVQKSRRRNIAVLRNTLIYSTLQNEEYAVWMDSDIIDITPGTVDKMIASGKDIITPGCQFGEDGIGRDYDLNAWKGKRTKPNQEEMEAIKRGATYVPRHILDGEGGTKFVIEMRSPGIDFVELDSVGGTLLFVKTEVFRKGVSFPPYYVIGADWDMMEGYDGIETEGLCYVARTLGYKCWGMPNDGKLYT